MLTYPAIDPIAFRLGAPAIGFVVTALLAGPFIDSAIERRRPAPRPVRRLIAVASTVGAGCAVAIGIASLAPDLGAFPVRWYGLSYVVGIAALWWLLARRALAPGFGWRPEQVGDLVFYGAFGGVLGGRLGSVLFYNLPSYLADPVEILKIWHGGMSFHGGLIGVLVALWLYARGARRRYIDVIDYFAPAVPIGLLCGRLGNFANAELWGKPSTLPWAMVFPDPAAGGIARHPSQLYEALLEGAVLFAILWWSTRRPRAAGYSAGLFLLLYAVFRCAIEFVREPDAHLGYLAWGWVTMGQVLSVPMLLFGAWLLIRARAAERAARGAPASGTRA
jgi:phosphatidylglycerol:prolipoprotein diacylglycerol transferase